MTFQGCWIDHVLHSHIAQPRFTGTNVEGVDRQSWLQLVCGKLEVKSSWPFTMEMALNCSRAVVC